MGLRSVQCVVKVVVLVQAYRKAFRDALWRSVVGFLCSKRKSELVRTMVLEGRKQIQGSSIPLVVVRKESYFGQAQTVLPGAFGSS